MNYTVEIIAKNEDKIRFKIKNEEHFLTFNEVFNLWESNPNFIQFYVSELRNMGLDAFYWEHPALKTIFLENNYECIIQRSIPLETKEINENAFSDYIYKNEQVVDFMNLGKNARLVIPTKQSEKSIYNHLGKFINYATEEQIIAVFQRVGQKIKEEIEKKETIWLNTAGLGIIWLHIRLDTKPKYYKTKQYKDEVFLGKK